MNNATSAFLKVPNMPALIAWLLGAPILVVIIVALLL